MGSQNSMEAQRNHMESQEKHIRKKQTKKYEIEKHMHALHEHVCVHIPPQASNSPPHSSILGHYSEQVAA